MATVEIKVPNIGDFADVSVIELLVRPRDTVLREQSLVTVESDKASMEIPCSHAGVVQEMRVQLGDRVSEGSVILTLQVDEGTVSDKKESDIDIKKSISDKKDIENNIKKSLYALEIIETSKYANDVSCDVLVLGGGPGGYSAAFRAADLGLRVVLVERYATLGGVCLNVGCIPSKALLHVAAVMDAVQHLGAAGIAYGEPRVDLAQLRTHKNQVVSRLTSGLAHMAKMRKVTVLRGTGQFVAAQQALIHASDGEQICVQFQRAIIAVGSRAVHLPFFPKDDPRVLDSTGALDLRNIPQRMLIVGGGIIGLEMGSVYSTLGARLDVVEMQDVLMPGADRDLVKVWQKMNAPRFDHILLNTKTVAAETVDAGIRVTFAAAQNGVSVPAPQTYDMVLQAVGRAPNGGQIGADKAGVAVDARGFIGVDEQMRTNVAHIFAIGDVVGQPMLAHKAVHEAHVAAEVIAGELTGDKALASAAFSARVIPSVAYTDPEVAWVGLSEDQARAQGIQVKKGLFPWAASGRAIANGRDEGFTKLLFDDSDGVPGRGRIVGGGIVGTHAGDMIGEIALAIEMGADAVDIGKTIHPHPTLGESLGMAAEAAHGTCTDLPPQRRK